MPYPVPQSPCNPVPRPIPFQRAHARRVPVTKLGRLVKAGKIKSMEEIYLHSLPIKEYQIVDFFLPKLKDEVMKVRINPDFILSRRGGLIYRACKKLRAPEWNC